MPVKIPAPGRYKTVHAPWHPKANNVGYVYEHLVVAEKALGKYLPLGAEVHHVDGNKLNNKASNLVICQDTAYHTLLHLRSRTAQAGGDPNSQRVCILCGSPKDFAMFYKKACGVSLKLQSACIECSTVRQRRSHERRMELQRVRRRAEASSRLASLRVSGGGE